MSPAKEGDIVKNKRIRRMRIISFIAIVVIAVLVASLISVLLSEKKKTTYQTMMDSYTRTFISAYNEDLSFFHNSTYNNFWFYSNNYDITALISSSRGAAVWIEKSTQQYFRCDFVTQSIGIGLFGGYVSGKPSAFGGNSGVYFFKDNYVGNANLDVGNNSTLIVENCNINLVNYHFVILKDSNEEDKWNITMATSDAKLIFNDDLILALSQSEEIRERYAEPELNALLEIIVSKWRVARDSNGTVVYTMTQMDNDLKEIEEKARTQYGITNSSDFVNRSLNYLKTLPTPPNDVSLSKQPDNWVYVTLCGFYPMIVFMVHSIVKLKVKDEDWKQIGNDQLIDGVFISLGYAVLAVNYPYNSPNAFLEILLTIFIAGVSSITAIRIKKRLLAPRPSRVDAPKGTNEKSSEKQKRSPKTKQKIR